MVRSVSGPADMSRAATLHAAPMLDNFQYSQYHSCYTVYLNIVPSFNYTALVFSVNL